MCFIPPSVIDHLHNMHDHLNTPCHQEKGAVQLVVCGVWPPVRLEEPPNRVLIIQNGDDRREAKVFRAHAAPQGVCDNLINALRLFGEMSRRDMLVVGLQERSRLKMMEELGRLITAIQKRERTERRREKKKGHKKRVLVVAGRLEVRAFIVHRGLWNIAPKENAGRQRSATQRRGRINQRIQCVALIGAGCVK